MSVPVTPPLRSMWVLVPEKEGEDQAALTLENTTVTANILGPLAEVTVAQQFRNTLSSPAEITCHFPLPQGAAVLEFTFEIGSRLVRGEVQETEQARLTYRSARDSGQRAGLLERRRPNLFEIRLANILPGEVILATIRYEERLKVEDGIFEFVYPMGLTPRYADPGHPEEAAGVFHPVAQPGSPIGPLHLRVSVDSGVAVEDPTSPSHPIRVDRHDAQRFEVSLTGEQIPDRDFVLRYSLAFPQVSGFAWVSQPGETGTFLAAVFPPPLSEDFHPAPREFVFVLDRSGSMSGEPIAQARNALRACIRSLDASDTFRILCFSDRFEWYRPGPTPVTQAEIDQADVYLSRVTGGGGTDIVQALQAVLDLPQDSTRGRLIVFLTDGAVSAEERILDLTRKRAGAARIFTFGIGPAVNRALLYRMAELGRGTAEFLQLQEDIEGAILRFQDRVTYPLLTDLQLSAKGARTWDIYPETLPDLYAGQTLEIAGRSSPASDNEPAILTLHGIRGGKKEEIHLTLPTGRQIDPRIERAWARARIDDLLRQIESDPGRSETLRAQIIGLALDQHLVTPYTTFVAVDLDRANPNRENQLLPVAQPLPAGLSWEGFFGSGLPDPNLARPLVTPPGPALQTHTASFESGIHSMLSLREDSFSRNKDRPRSASTSRESVPPGRVFDPEPRAGDRDGTLRWLARTQDLDGSWHADLEWTGAALLAFIRAGHTTRVGQFRKVVTRAAAYLAGHPGSGFSAYVRALALDELARATNLDTDRESARQAVQSLPDPGSHLEKAILSRLQGLPFSGSLPGEPVPLDEIRLAGILNRPSPIEVPDPEDPNSGLFITWLSTLPRRE